MPNASLLCIYALWKKHVTLGSTFPLCAQRPWYDLTYNYLYNHLPHVHGFYFQYSVHSAQIQLLLINQSISVFNGKFQKQLISFKLSIISSSIMKSSTFCFCLLGCNHPFLQSIYTVPENSSLNSCLYDEKHY